MLLNNKKTTPFADVPASPVPAPPPARRVQPKGKDVSTEVSVPCTWLLQSRLPANHGVKQLATKTAAGVRPGGVKEPHRHWPGTQHSVNLGLLRSPGTSD